MLYWVSYIGTSNGAWIEAPTPKQAKLLFMVKEGVNISLSYLKASKNMEWQTFITKENYSSFSNYQMVA